MQCEECEEKRKADGRREKYIYYGETSRGCYIRNEGHVRAYKKKEGSEEGFMWNHACGVHEGRKDLSFKMKREATDRDPMRRVLRESVKINNSKNQENIILMNSKSEYFGPQIVRATFGME